MKFVKQDITSYTSSQLSPEYATWSPLTTYAIGDNIIYGNYIWKNSFTSNLNNIPSEESPYWVKYSVSNYYAMIDLQSQTKTTYNGDLIIEFPFSLIDTIVIGYFKAQQIKVENISNTNTVLATQIFNQSPNEEVYDYFDYIYQPYTIETNRATYFKIKHLGTKIRITFYKGTQPNIEIGFLVGGIAVDMGRTKEDVKMGWTSFSTRTTDNFGIMTINKKADQDIFDFETTVPSINAMSLRRKAKQNKDEIMAFIIDEADNSIYENIITLGIMQEVIPVATNYDKTTLTWSILESI